MFFDNRLTDADMQRVHDSCPQLAFKTACRKAGVPGRILHDFRRTAVRNLKRAGVPRSVAMRLVGHKTESVYRRYAIADERDLRVAVERLDASAVG